MHNAKQVVNYIGRYSHRIAISNHRIKSVDGDKLSFSWFNYRTSKPGVMELDSDEFLRRFSMHILPSGFMKIRHFGILSSRNKTEALACAREFLGVQPPVSIKGIPWENLFETIYGRKPFICPVCKVGEMVMVECKQAKARGSPKETLLPNYNFSKQAAS